MIGTLGGPELILILVIALIVFGPRKLPDIGKSVGKMMVEFRKASTEFKRTVEMEVEAEKRLPRPTKKTPSASAKPVGPEPTSPPESSDASEKASATTPGGSAPETPVTPPDAAASGGTPEEPTASPAGPTPEPPTEGRPEPRPAPAASEDPGASGATPRPEPH